MDLWSRLDVALKSGWGDWASAIGLIMTVIGFCLTLVGVWRSKSAAEKAKQAVIEVQQDIRRIDTVAELSAAISAMNEIKALQRKAAWEILPDPLLRAEEGPDYRAQRKCGSTYRKSTNTFPADDNLVIQQGAEPRTIHRWLVDHLTSRNCVFRGSPMTHPSTAKLIKRSSALLTQTKQGRLTWAPTENPGVFETNFPDYSIRIAELDAELFYKVEIYNNEGRLTDSATSYQMENEGIPEGENTTGVLDELYELAIGQAFGIKLSMTCCPG